MKGRKIVKTITAIVLLIPAGTGFAGDFIVPDSITGANITPYVDFIENKHNAMTIDDAVRADGEWKPVPGASINFGFAKYTYWFRFTVAIRDITERTSIVSETKNSTSRVFSMVGAIRNGIDSVGSLLMKQVAALESVIKQTEMSDSLSQKIVTAYRAEPIHGTDAEDRGAAFADGPGDIPIEREDHQFDESA